MSTSTTNRNFNGNGPAPAWVKTVNEKMLYNAEESDASEKEALTEATSSPPSDEASVDADASSLGRELALATTDPSGIPTPDPDLQPTPAGHVRIDLDKQLEKAVSVLSSHYNTDLPRSLILEYALQRTLVQLREQGNESPLVQWLDSELLQQ